MQVEIEGTVSVTTTDKSWHQVEWVNYDNRAWLAPLWFVSDNGQWILPVRLIAPTVAPSYNPLPGVEALEFFQKVPIPRALLENADAPEEEAPLLDILEGPRIYARNPSAGAH